ncbi:MAG TPA: hypothetical protein VFB34_08910 [Chloroflexota bacterium]|nr:hypothetical protein [Chloroflexota bacterium]
MTDEMNDEWRRYGESLIDSMGEVLKEAEEAHHPVLLETADYWLSLGLAIGLKRPEEAERLLTLIESEPARRCELDEDADAFLQEVLE